MSGALILALIVGGYMLLASGSRVKLSAKYGITERGKYPAGNAVFYQPGKLYINNQSGHEVTLYNITFAYPDSVMNIPELNENIPAGALSFPNSPDDLVLKKGLNEVKLNLQMTNSGSRLYFRPSENYEITLPVRMTALTDENERVDVDFEAIMTSPNA